MKRINQYKKMFNVEKDINLKELKKSYRNLVKEWHPDKFQDGDPKKEEAEVMSRQIIDGYHFLVSIAPETKEAQLDEYTETITNTGFQDFDHKGRVLEVTFTDGKTYEYFGVDVKIFKKLINADNRYRFAKRNIFTSYLYRKSKKDLQEA
ncbi:DnaJ-like protein [Nonlabens dokdonensis]|jgi:DnaJ-class molecular chaperone|uniref:Heat shock protein Hsp n=2 Tax=Nonlabens dokdonensis TaxID=328515 RepID=L7W9J0_NONDD|nr:KTSC domain-containing protein [Nonlabens dokdonensis]AGC78345.1 heat shock protein Hsp [Nonlabens dokdonensis DSW-6]PZX38097.1 DnaJ-like protein [Nonlabens dokdonensis]